MAGLQEDDEGFQVVKKKKGRQNIKTRNVDSISDVADDFIDTEGLKVKLWQSRSVAQNLINLTLGSSLYGIVRLRCNSSKASG